MARGVVNVPPGCWSFDSLGHFCEDARHHGFRFDAKWAIGESRDERDCHQWVLAAVPVLQKVSCLIKLLDAAARGLPTLHSYDEAMVLLRQTLRGLDRSHNVVTSGLEGASAASTPSAVRLGMPCPPRVPSLLSFSLPYA